MHIICLSETMLLNESPHLLPASLRDYSNMWSVALKDKTRGRGSGGLLCLTHPALVSETIEITPWWIFFRICAGLRNIVVGSVYFKPTLQLDQILELFQLSLDEIQSKFQSDIIILGGDMNATIADFEDDLPPEIVYGTRLYEHRETSVTETNERGEMLMSFMTENGFILLNGRTTLDHPGRFTSSRSTSTLDLTWVSADHAGSIIDMEDSSTLLGSNHLSLTLSLALKTDFSSPHDDDPPSIVCLDNSPPAVSQNPKLIWKADKFDVYSRHLANSVRISEASPEHDLNTLNELICDAIKEAASASGMRKISRPFNSYLQGQRKSPWFDAECHRLKTEARKLFKKIYDPNFNMASAVTFNEKNKLYRKETMAKKKAYKSELSEKYSNVKNSITFWETCRAVKGRPETREVIILDEWSEFLLRTYPGRSSWALILPDTPLISMDLPISPEELNRSIKSMKGGKAPGEDSISANFYKYLPQDWKSILLDLFNRVLITGEVPDAWTKIALCMIYKKGDQRDPLNYRGIALINVITKHFTSILNERVYDWAEMKRVIPEEQAGFRQSRGAVDNLFSLQAIIQNRLRQTGGKVYSLFVDFRRAFDSVPQHQLWLELLGLGVSSRIIKVIKNLYDHSTMHIRTQKGSSAEVDVSEGALQGEVPDAWTKIALCMIYKKGDQRDPLNYRGIALINVITKHFTSILNERVYDWAEMKRVIPEEQAGFRQSRGAVDNLFSLQAIIQNRLRQTGGKVYSLFVDFRRAFDSVPQHQLWLELLGLGVSSRIIKVIKNLYDHSTMHIRTQKGSSAEVDVSEGALQGEKLSPLLFNLYLSDLVSFFRSREVKGVDINDRTDIFK
ncbi:uncharacterized protein LOC107044261 [Diachasma alloeum]|uniref:uncharacterized protein LOC107044261 n=1 Tax=Diachasma alloeum TaxID=454923 RepID=UPI0007383383|nr:uncharacterized protein LOC107044261 [Diachasma alloeum]